MAQTSEVVKKLVEVLHDSRKGFEDLGQKVQDPQIRSFFEHEGQTRQQFANQLSEALSGNSRPDPNEGTTAGTLHRNWGNLKAKFGTSDHSLLETAEQGEDTAKRAYKTALEDTDLPPQLRSLIERQQAHVLSSHDTVKAMRDQKAA